MTDEEKKFKIIIVDDDDFLVDMYALKFGGVGVSAEACKSGTALIEKLKAGYRSDLILLDIVMPGMDGIETLRTIRKDKLGEGIPVVMLTNQNDERNISDAKLLGINGYIVKSAATPSEVVDEVMKILKDPNYTLA
jgi:CheY-like chemotaxis protein